MNIDLNSNIGISFTYSSNDIEDLIFKNKDLKKEPINKIDKDTVRLLKSFDSKNINTGETNFITQFNSSNKFNVKLGMSFIQSDFYNSISGAEPLDKAVSAGLSYKFEDELNYDKNIGHENRPLSLDNISDSVSLTNADFIDNIAIKMTYYEECIKNNSPENNLSHNLESLNNCYDDVVNEFTDSLSENFEKFFKGEFGWGDESIKVNTEVDYFDKDKFKNHLKEIVYSQRNTMEQLKNSYESEWKGATVSNDFSFFKDKLQKLSDGNEKTDTIENMSINDIKETSKVINNLKTSGISTNSSELLGTSLGIYKLKSQLMLENSNMSDLLKNIISKGTDNFINLKYNLLYKSNEITNSKFSPDEFKESVNSYYNKFSNLMSYRSDKQFITNFCKGIRDVRGIMNSQFNTEFSSSVVDKWNNFVVNANINYNTYYINSFSGNNIDRKL